MSDLGISDAQPNQGQDAAANNQPNAQANAQGAGNGPWANQLTQFGELAPQVDAFLRSTVQPYITQLEQERGQLRDQARLYTSLNEAPAETYLQITSELFGDEAVDAVINLLAGDDEDDDDEQEVTPVAGESRDPEVEAFMQEYRGDKLRQSYNSELERVKSAAQKRIDEAAQNGQTVDDVPVRDDLFHTFVAISDGDFDSAYDSYKKFYSDFRSELFPEQNQTEQTATGAPPALGAAQTPPPVEKQYSSIDDALDDFFRENRASQAPPVGST